MYKECSQHVSTVVMPSLKEPARQIVCGSINLEELAVVYQHAGTPVF